MSVDRPVDRAALRREAEEILNNPDLWRLHSFASDVLGLIDELILEDVENYEGEE